MIQRNYIFRHLHWALSSQAVYNVAGLAVYNMQLLGILMNIGAQGADTAFHDLRALVNVLLYPVECFHIFRTAQELNKIFIMSNHQKLKVALV